MSDQRFDAIVVGGGHNGLVAATRLARSGLKVVVLEAGAETGGMARWHEIHPGFRVPSLAHLVPGLHPRVARELGLQRRIRDRTTGRVTSLAIPKEGQALAIDPDPRRAVQAIGAHSRADGAAWADFHQRMAGHADALGPLIASTPPGLDFGNRGNLLQLGRLGWSVRRQGRKAMRELLRIITMNVADLIEENFESDAVQGMLALDAVLGTDHGPRSSNTVFTFLHRLAQHGGAPIIPAGHREHPAALLDAAARKAGVDIRTEARVSRIHVAAGCVRGVELADGAVFEAATVVAGTDPVTTLADLVGPDHLDSDFLGDVRAIRNRGTTGKVNLALERLPDLPMPADRGPARWVLASSLDAVERAFDQVKYGGDVAEPALEITLPSLSDPGCAPEGGHVMSVNVAYAPYRDGAGGALGDAVIDRIEAHAPGFSASVLACEAWAPADIEARFGTRGGHWHHGDIALDQYFMTRPVPGFAQYRTPVDGLYLCGAGTHPGGGVTGINGSNAAREILREGRQGRSVA